MGATWGHRPHNFLGMGAIAPMESAPMGSVALTEVFAVNRGVAKNLFVFFFGGGV